MKKNIIIIALAVLFMMTSCATAGQGAANGAYFGSILGSAIGGLSGGYRGSDVGTIIGMAGGAILGAAAGEANEQAKMRDRQQYLEEKARLKANRDAREQKAKGNNYSYQQFDEEDSGYDAAGQYDDRIDIDFGSPEPAPSVSAATSSLEIRNARFIDENNDQMISRGESCDIVFEVYNNGDAAAYNIEPTVIETTRNKHILVSPSILVESIGAHKGVRYTARVVADRLMKNGTAKFVIKVVENGKPVEQVLSFDIELRK